MATCAIAAAQNVVTTIAGSAQVPGYVNAAGIAAQFRFNGASGSAVDSSGNVYVADSLNNAIRKIAPGGSVTTFAGSATGTPGFVDNTGTAARFNNPQGLAIDGANNLYVADAGNHAIRMITSGGVVTTLAGSGASGFTNASGTSAQFHSPDGVAVAHATGAAATVYVADTGNNVVRQIVVSTQAVTSVAGSSSGTAGYADGTGSGASFSGPQGILVDAAGAHLYLADTGNNAIRQIVVATGVASTIAGSHTGTAGYANGTGSAAQFNGPCSLTFDGSGNLLVVDSNNFVVRGVTTGGVVSLFAGTPLNPGTADGLALGAAAFSTGGGITAAGASTYYVVDSGNSTVRLINASAAPAFTVLPADAAALAGSNVTFSAGAVGNPAAGYRWQRKPAGGASFSNLSDGAPYSGTGTDLLTITGATVAMNGDQFRLVGTNAVGTATSPSAQLTVTTGVVFSTVAGSAAMSGYLDGTGSAARFASPSGVVIGPSGTVYIADTANDVIRAIGFNGVVTTFAGQPGVSGASDGIGAAAQFNSPRAIAADTLGNLYVADTGNHLIRKITPGGVVSTLAGTALTSGSSNGNGAAALFSFPSGIAVDAARNVYVADTANDTIREIDPSSNVTTLAGSPGLAGSTDGTGSAARFSLPQGVAVDGSGNVFVADTQNATIREITSGGVVTTLAGSAGLSGSADGSGTTARFNQPKGIAVSGVSLYVADSANDTIRLVTTAGVVTTIAGFAGSTGAVDGVGTSVRFNQAMGVALDAATNLYVADTGNDLVRRTGLVVAPAIQTQPSSAAVGEGSSASFSVAATGVPTLVYQWQRQAAGTSGFANLTNGAIYSGVTAPTLTISGTTAAMSGDQFQVVLSNLVSAPLASSAATLTINAVAPSISTQPASVAINPGGTASFSVTATGSGSLSYQWTMNGVALSGATNATLTIPNAQVTNAGSYAVVVSNATGATTSGAATLTINTAPYFVVPPRAQFAVAGDTVTFSTSASGAAGLTYQWNKNGVAIAGATNATLTLLSVAGSDAASYEVVVTNSLGSTASSLAQLTVETGPTAPLITASPVSQTATVGGSVTFSVAAAATPAPTYQWRKNGAAIGGATNSTLTLTNIQTGDAGSYDVVVGNSAGSATSGAAVLKVIARSYAGTYFGTIANGIGDFAVYVRADNTGVLLGYIPSVNLPLITLNLLVSDNGQFSYTSGAAGSIAAVTIAGTIASDGTISGAVSGGASAGITGSKSPSTGSTQGFAGLYLAGAATNAASLVTIASAAGQVYALAQSASGSDGGAGTLSGSGAVAVNTGRTTITALIASATGAVVATSSGAVNGSFAGAVEGSVALQRLANISTRAQVSGGDSVAIAGFVITGTEAKPVLIRAVGPTLTNFNVAGALATPKLDLYRSSSLIASNTGFGSAPNSAAITAAAMQIGAFALTGNDSAILTTLPPGGYTAQVSGTNSASGIALVEVYDLSASAAGQKLVNISTRAAVGAGDNALIAGVIVNGSIPKRVLIRAVGPGLTSFNLTGVLAKPVLTLTTLAGQMIAQNTGWNTSGDAAAITSAGVQVGAFPLTTGDSALIVTLPPGGYSATVTGTGGSTGIALVEIYELQ